MSPTSLPKDPLPAIHSPQWQARVARFIAEHKDVPVTSLYAHRDHHRTAAAVERAFAKISTVSATRAAVHDQIADALDAAIEARLNALMN